MTHFHTPPPAGETSHIAFSDAMVEAARNAFKRRGWGYRDDDIRAALSAALAAEPGEAVAADAELLKVRAARDEYREIAHDRTKAWTAAEALAHPHPLPLKEERHLSLDEQKTLDEARLRSGTVRQILPLKEEVERVLEGLIDVVGNMRVPQNTAEAALQVTVTIGPALEAARSLLSRIRAGAQEGWRDIPVMDETISYVWHYGGRCRDCADAFGVCPTSGLPCEPDEAKAAIRHVLRAVNYGMSNGYLNAASSPEAKGGRS